MDISIRIKKQTSGKIMHTTPISKGVHVILERGFFVSQLNQVELQNLRHIIGEHDVVTEKCKSYAQQAMDPQVRDYFDSSSQDAMNTKQQLMTFLK